MCCVNIMIPFQLVFLPNTCEAYSRNIYIPATVELTKNDPNLTLHKWFLGFNLMHMHITDYQFIQSLNVTPLTPEQLKQLAHTLPNYTMVNYDSLREQIQQIDENYLYSMPTWLIILTTVLGILIIGTGITVFLYCKYKHTSNCSKSPFIFWHKKSSEETEAMLLGSAQQLVLPLRSKQLLRSKRNIRIARKGFLWCWQEQSP